MKFQKGQLLAVRDPSGKPSPWDGVVVSVEEEGEAYGGTRVKFVTVPRRGVAITNYVIGDVTRLTTNWLSPVAPLSPFEESIRSYIRDEFKELGLT